MEEQLNQVNCVAPLRSALISDPITIAADSTIRQGIQLLHQAQSRSPHLRYGDTLIVTHNHTLLGMVTPLSLLRCLIYDIDVYQTKVTSLLSEPPIYLPLPLAREQIEEAHALCQDPLVLQQALSLMQLHRSSCLPVVDTEEQILGLLTSHSLLAAMGPESLMRSISVTEVIDPQIPHIDPQLTVRAAAQEMTARNCSWVAVGGVQRNQLGQPPKALHACDLVAHWISHQQTALLPAAAIASPISLTVRSDQTTWQVFQEMEQKGERVVLVADADNTVLGTVTPFDLLTVLDQTWTRGPLDPELIWPHIPAAIWVVDETLSLTLILGRESTQLGLDPQLALGKPMAQAWHGDQQESHLHYHQQALRGYPVVYEIRVKEESYLCRLQLLPQNRGVIGVAIRQTRSNQLQADRPSLYDPLTQLPNRVWITQSLPQLIDQSRQHEEQLALLLLDLDDFKTINDSFDHSTGDRLLQVVAKRLGNCLTPDQVLARLGGDEFLIVMPNVQVEQEAINLAENLLAALAATMVVEGHEITVTAGLGISFFPSDGEKAERLIKHADAAMFRAKSKARHSYEIHTGEITAVALDRLTLENRLRRALQAREFQVYYQPKVEIRSGQIVGAEALLRWQQPELGWVTPAKFIPLAEDLGLLDEIGPWVLEQACQDVKSWHRAGWPHLQVAVNLSPSQFRESALAERVAEILRRVDLDPGYLELEITETMAAQDFHHTLGILNRLNRMGVKLSIDDFGTGYSSISYLRRFPVDEIKVDRSFIRDLNTRPDPKPVLESRPRTPEQDDVAVVAAIIHLAHSLGLQVVAEGVETLTQLDLLQKLNCDQGQGYFWSRPIPTSVFLNLLDGNSSLMG